MDDGRVLVTGGSGFIAGHCILQLVATGRRVRTTVRDLRRADDVRAVLTSAGMPADADLEFVAADLTSDEGWPAAVAGCEHVLHVASPVHLGPATDEDAVVGPAREGTVRVLRAARGAGVSRVVLTSAFHAVGFGHGKVDLVFTEADWPPLDGPGMDAYGRSKVLAERAAWDFVEREGGSMELTVLLPVAVMGPVLGRAVSGANHVVQRLLTGQVPGYPAMYFPVVDVRDVAQAHVTAMTAEGAAGGRILVATDHPPMAMAEMGALLRRGFGDAASKVPTRRMPDVVVRLAARFRPEFRPVAADLHVQKRVSTTRSRQLLGLRPRDPEEAVLAAGRSMLDRGLA